MKNFFGRVFSTVIGIFVFCAIFFGLFLMLILIGSAENWFSKKGIKENSILEIRLDDKISEGPTDTKSSFLSFSDKNTIYYKDILDIISSAKDDENIKGISLKLSSFNGGETQRDEIRRVLQDFKKSGKFIYSYINNSDQDSYYISTIADSLFLNPVGEIDFAGKSIDVQFYKNLGDKYGIDFQVIRHGAYKSAVEPFIRTDLSPENELQLTELLTGIWSNMIVDISKSRKIDTAKLNTIADSLYSMIPNNALQNKLVDELVQESEYDKILMKKMKVSEKEDLNLISIEEYQPESKEKYSGDHNIAIIYASGQIFNGKGSDGIYSEDFKTLIQDIKEDEDIKAVVLRVNSPGGSANASDEILFELQQLQAKKPLVVSFGEYAASGGYYISMAADKIYSEKNTLTGSIGVLGMIPSFKQMANNVGITTDKVQTNANASFSPFEKLSEGTKSILEKSIESTYLRFTSVVGKNRQMNFKQVDAIGGGRIWTGDKAKEIGLVDALGSLDDAIQFAAEKAKIKDDFRVESYPKAKDEFQEFMNNLSGKNAASEILKAELGEENYQIYSDIKAIKSSSGIMMLIPMKIKVN